MLVPSPLLGPATWQPTSRWLEEAGHDCLVLDVDRAASQAPAGSILVPHSNAGYHAPRLAAARNAAATVYVDAALAPLDLPATTLAPPEFLSFLEGLADADGLLPPWTEWWPDLDGVFPSRESRARVEAEQPRLPLSYFTQRVAVPPHWSARPNAYLAFGATYADEIALSESLGWPTRVLDGAHLHQLHDPAGVGAALVELSAASLA